MFDPKEHSLLISLHKDMARELADISKFYKGEEPPRLVHIRGKDKPETRAYQLVYSRTNIDTMLETIVNNENGLIHYIRESRCRVLALINGKVHVIPHMCELVLLESDDANSMYIQCADNGKKWKIV